MEFFTAWVTGSLLGQLVLLMATSRKMPPAISRSFTLDLHFSRLILALVFTADLLHRWQTRPPSRGLLLLIGPIGLVGSICFNTPLFSFFESISRLPLTAHSPDPLTRQLIITLSINTLGVIVLGWMACRHLPAMQGGEGRLAFFGLALAIGFFAVLRYALIFLAVLLNGQLARMTHPPIWLTVLQMVSIAAVPISLAWAIAFAGNAVSNTLWKRDVTR